MLRKLFGFSLRKIQGIFVYRRVASLLRNGVSIQEAEEQDLIRIHAWLRPGDSRRSVTRNSRTTNFVAKNRGKTVGFVQLVRHPENDHPFSGYWLFSLVVRTLYRGMGIGEMLSRAVIEKATEEGADELFLLLRQDNHRAIKLYHKLGFEMKVIPVLEEQLEKERLSLGYRRVPMSKPLNPEQCGRRGLKGHDSRSLRSLEVQGGHYENKSLP